MFNLKLFAVHSYPTILAVSFNRNLMTFLKPCNYWRTSRLSLSTMIGCSKYTVPAVSRCTRPDVRERGYNRRKPLGYRNEFDTPTASWCLSISRGYAKKSKESAKRGKTEKSHVQLSDEELNQVIEFDKMKSQMQTTVEHLKKEYADQLNLRTSVSMLDRLNVETADGNFPLMQLGQIVQKSPQLVMINLAATPQYIACVKTAILGSGVNVNPQQEGTTLYIPVPKMTREHREGLAKNAKVLCEKTKEKLRHIQNNYARDLKKLKDVHSEDLVFNVHETILITTKQFMDETEAVMASKQSELLGN